MKRKLLSPFKEKGVFSGKRVLTATLACATLLGTSLFAVAGTGHQIGTGDNAITLQSQGRLVYDDQATGNNVTIDSADFDTLGTAIFNCEEAITASTGKSITDLANGVLTNIDTGDVKLTPAGFIKDFTGTADKATLVGQKFSGLLAKSVEVDCEIPDGDYTQHDGTTVSPYYTDADGNNQKCTPITEANLSKGTCGYDDHGDLIIGTGEDNEKYLQDIKDNPLEYGITPSLELIYNKTQSGSGKGSISGFGLECTVPQDGYYYIIAPDPTFNEAGRCYEGPTKRLTTVTGSGTLTRDFTTGMYELASGTKITYTARIGNETTDNNGLWGGGIALVILKVG